MIQQLLQRKYEDCYFQEDKKENKPSLTIYASRYELPSEEEPIWKECFGRIDIFISQNETIYNYPYIYNVHIDYWDQINTDKHENKLLDELSVLSIILITLSMSLNIISDILGHLCLLVSVFHIKVSSLFLFATMYF